MIDAIIKTLSMARIIIMRAILLKFLLTLYITHCNNIVSILIFYS